MKKLIIGICAVALCFAAGAQEQDAASSAQAAKQEKASWPVWVAFNSTKNIDVIGARFTLPYGACENVTGFDIGFFGRARYFEGLQLNVLRNDVADSLAGIQVGLYNSAGRADRMCIQVGLWNEAHSFYGCQIGLVNLTEVGTGCQIGLINRADALYGFQAGAVNVIRESEYVFLPIVNIGFDTYTDPKF